MSFGNDGGAKILAPRCGGLWTYKGAGPAEATCKKRRLQDSRQSGIMNASGGMQPDTGHRAVNKCWLISNDAS